MSSLGIQGGLILGPPAEAQTGDAQVPNIKWCITTHTVSPPAPQIQSTTDQNTIFQMRNLGMQRADWIFIE